MVRSGLINHGWTYINIDDFWQNHIPTTCGGCAGSWLHEKQDAQTYAQWGFDLLKYDWCSYGSVTDGTVANPLNVPVRKNSRNDDYAIHPYKVMGGFLRDQPRDIIFSLCQYGNNDVWKWGASVHGTCWRTTGDVNDSWRSIKQIGFYQDKAAPFAKVTIYNTGLR